VGGTGQEIEVKFYVLQLEPIRRRLDDAGCLLKAPRVHEINLRFDNPDRTLTQARRVLRLRKDRQAHLAYKGRGVDEEGVRKRQELEVEVSSFDTAQALLEALGYEISFIYEKYRTTYLLGDLVIVLDEMPYGQFVEIEGPSADKIQQLALRLGLDWQARILHSYSYLFEKLSSELNLKFRDLTFDNFRELRVSADALGVSPAD
jgi:adenylate cyclase, class 2